METQIIRGGYKVVVADTHISKWQIETQDLVHDNFLPHLVAKHLKPGFCVIDCGALCGDHTKLYSDCVGDNGGLVIAIEPCKIAYECLVHNASLFKYRNTLVFQVALGENSTDIIQHEVNENLGASVCKIVKEPVVGETYLRSTTIDIITEEAQRPINFIKIDCEGWETAILLGASKTIAKFKPGLLIEVNDGALKNQGSDADEIFEILEYHGYTYEIAQPECTLDSPQYDLLCFPKVKSEF